MEVQFESDGAMVPLEVDVDDTVYSIKEKVCKAFHLGNVDAFELRIGGTLVEDDAVPTPYQPQSPVCHFRPITAAHTSSTTSGSSVFTHVSSSSTVSTSISDTPLANGDVVSVQRVGYPTHEVAMVDLLDECVEDSDEDEEPVSDSYSNYTCDDMTCEDSESCLCAFTMCDKQGECLVVGRPGALSTLRVFNTTGKLLNHLYPAINTTSLAASANGTVFALSATEGHIHAWETKDGAKHPVALPCGTHIKRIEMSPCGDYLGAYGDSDAQVWSIANAPESYTLQLRVPVGPSLRMISPLHGVPCFFASDSAGAAVQCWALRSASLVKTFELQQPATPEASIVCAVSRAARAGYSDDDDAGSLEGCAGDESSFVVVGSGNALAVHCSAKCDALSHIYTDIEEFQAINISPCGRFITAQQGQGALCTYTYINRTLSLLHCRSEAIYNSFCTTECGGYLLACRDDRVDTIKVTEREPFCALTVSLPCSDPLYEKCELTPLGKLAVVTEEDKVFLFK